MGVLDAWAYGLPVITTPVGGIPDIAIDGKNLLLFNPGDINELSEQMSRMISNKKLRDSIAKESIRLSETTFNLKSVNEQVGILYNQMLGLHYRWIMGCLCEILTFVCYWIFTYLRIDKD